VNAKIVGRTLTLSSMKYSASPSILLVDNMAELAWLAIEPLWDSAPLHSPARLSDFLADLTPGQRGLLAIDWCQKEIRNGGIMQLLANATGALVPFALDGFRLIGAHPYAAILAEVVPMLGDGFPLDRPSRKRAIKALSPTQRQRIDILDDAFLELIATPDHDLEQYRGHFVKGHPGDFVQHGGTG
jgi:hypothetical protein